MVQRMKKKVFPSSPTPSRHDFNQKLLGYSTLSRAALATGAAVVGAATTASAQTVTPITISGSVSITPVGGSPDGTFHHSEQLFDLGLPGSAGVYLSVRQHNYTSHRALGIASAVGKGAGESHVSFITAPGDGAVKFTHNQHITGHGGAGNATLFRTQANGLNGGQLHLGTKTYGQFHLSQPGYIGFKFNNGVHSYYGWLRVEVGGDGNGRPDSITLVSENGDVGACPGGFFKWSEH